MASTRMITLESKLLAKLWKWVKLWENVKLMTSWLCIMVTPTMVNSEQVSHLTCKSINTTLTTQYAKKVFNFKVTLFGYEGNAELAHSFGADGFQILSTKNIGKNNEKYHHVIITDVIREEEAVTIQNVAWRTGRAIFAIDMGYYPEVKVFDMVCSKSLIIQVNVNLLE